jgi:sRNA-binding regulator protein Hfq
MANTPQIPAKGLHEVRSSSTAPATGGPRPTSSDNGNQEASLNTGPRKLVRPTLPARVLREASHSPRSESPLLTHQVAMTAPTADEASHAEAFYFQKQMQMQTLMTFVLEDGEQIDGFIEWYDRHAIKVRNGSRMLIYKSCIKYLHKAGENNGQ